MWIRLKSKPRKLGSNYEGLTDHRWNLRSDHSPVFTPFRVSNIYRETEITQVEGRM